MKILNYNQPPESIFNLEDYSSWEKYSLPLGNGYFGACIFGRADKERIQLTENSIANPYHSHHERLCCGLQSFGDIFIDFHFCIPKFLNKTIIKKASSHM